MEDSQATCLILLKRDSRLGSLPASDEAVKQNYAVNVMRITPVPVCRRLHLVKVGLAPLARRDTTQRDPRPVQRLEQLICPVGVVLDQPELGAAGAGRMPVAGRDVANEVLVHAGEEAPALTARDQPAAADRADPDAAILQHRAVVPDRALEQRRPDAGCGRDTGGGV